MTKPVADPPLVVNGWSILAHQQFLDTFIPLVAQVERLCAMDPSGYLRKNATKRLAAIIKLAFEVIPQDPTRPEYRQGTALGDTYRHWFRAKFFSSTDCFFAITVTAALSCMALRRAQRFSVCRRTASAAAAIAAGSPRYRLETGLS